MTRISALLLLLATAALADVLAVGPGGFDSIPSALAAAEPGDTVRVSGGPYPGSLVLDVPDVSLVTHCRAVIEGDGTAPVVTVAAAGVALEGFDIRGGTCGVLARDVEDVTIRDNHVHDSTDGGIRVSGTRNRIEDNEVFANDGQGIELGRAGGAASDANAVEGNRVRANGRGGGTERATSGIAVRNAEGNDVARNRSSDHAEGAGFFLGADADLNRFYYNRARENGGTDGFHIDGDGNLFVRNLARGNASDGFDVDGDDTALSRNVAATNGPATTRGDGFDVRGARSVLIANRAWGQTDEGFEVQGDDGQYAFNAAARNGGDGFDFGGLADGNTVRWSISWVNGGDGFQVSGAGNVFLGNDALRNDGIGYRDDSLGQGTAGTANSYEKNRCRGNVEGPSEPADLCDPAPFRAVTRRVAASYNAG